MSHRNGIVITFLEFPADIGTIRAYEDAATAVGRLDATAALMPEGLGTLLTLRAAVRPFDLGREGILALLRPGGAADEEPPQAAALRRYYGALRAGAARARGGGVPSVAYLRGLLAGSDEPAYQGAATHGTGAHGAATDGAATEGVEDLAATEAIEAIETIDAFLRDAPDASGTSAPRTPPVLKALCAGAALRALPSDDAELLAGLALSLVLCVGGALENAWLTLPWRELPAPPPQRLTSDASPSIDWNAWFGRAGSALAREARAAARGVTNARMQGDADEARIRAAFGRAAHSALAVFALLRDAVVLTVPAAAETLDVSSPTAGAAMARLVELGIAEEITGRGRSRVFVHTGSVNALA